MRTMKLLMVIAISYTCILTLKAQDKSSAQQVPLGVNEQRDLQWLKSTMGSNQTSSGLLYHEFSKGTGEKLPKFSKVKIQYTLGTIGASGKAIVPNKEVIEEVDKLPYGIQEAVRIMNVGSDWAIGLPVKLCGNKYGKLGGGKVLTGRLKLISTIK